MSKGNKLKEHLSDEDVKIKLQDINEHISSSDASEDVKEPLLAKSGEVEQAVGTEKFKETLEEFTGLLLEYEQYLPALFEFLKLYK